MRVWQNGSLRSSALSWRRPVAGYVDYDVGLGDCMILILVMTAACGSELVVGFLEMGAKGRIGRLASGWEFGSLGCVILPFAVLDV